MAVEQSGNKRGETVGCVPGMGMCASAPAVRLPVRLPTYATEHEVLDYSYTRQFLLLRIVAD